MAIPEKSVEGEVSGWKTLFFTTDHQCNLKKKSNCVVFMVKVVMNLSPMLYISIYSVFQTLI
jgi:hypothetical protein